MPCLKAGTIAKETEANAVDVTLWLRMPLGDVSYATVWRVADRNAIALKAEPAGGNWAKIAREVAANPNATQKELARKIGVSRSTVSRVIVRLETPPAKLITRIVERRR